MNAKLLLCYTAILLICSVGCERQDTKAGAMPPPVAGPVIPAPGNTPTPSPIPIPNDTLPIEVGKLNVVAAFPNPGELRVALVSPISVQFDAALIQGLELDTAMAVSSSAGAVAGSITQPEANTIVFRPDTLWQPETIYTISIHPTLMSADGLTISAGNTWQFITVADVYTTPQAVIDECMSDLDVEMLAAVNQARILARNCGENFRPAAGKLAWNCQLQQAAITHSEDMANNDFFSHTGSDGSSVGDRITRTGYLWSRAGENLAAGQRTVAVVMDGLLKSPGHCDNIMAAHYTEFGFGFRSNNNSYYVRYWTQNFARPFRF